MTAVLALRYMDMLSPEDPVRVLTLRDGVAAGWTVSGRTLLVTEDGLRSFVSPAASSSASPSRTRRPAAQRP